MRIGVIRKTHGQERIARWCAGLAAEVMPRPQGHDVFVAGERHDRPAMQAGRTHHVAGHDVVDESAAALRNAVAQAHRAIRIEGGSAQPEPP